ncbi:pentatricopeptide repeat-containing protein At2g38420, mitochondrial [Impatiens glandulifera]|uniref:pentatricopeptide repeat-containing protein At2g38420, mitochondrial n=1 Tax=Impatiens glandulifera TaxID=253017 RepID=UPI001FB0B6AF|nr:pentatricopeptide repeat-containing protein At2g38420, mitochondrial [Impatiens glandulifera]
MASTISRQSQARYVSHIAFVFRLSYSTRTPSAYIYYLRKGKKWPTLNPYRTKLHQQFDCEEALQALKLLSKSTSNNLLPSLIESFATYACTPTPEAYQFVFRKLTSSAKWIQASEVLNHIEKFEKFNTPEEILIDFIQIYGHANMIGDAIDIFFRIPKFRCNPTVNSLNSLLNILCWNREGIQIAPRILLKSESMQIRADESTFKILVKALCRIGKVDYAVKLLNNVVEGGYNLDGELCSLILSSIVENRCPSVVDILGFLKEMKKLGFCPGRVDWCNVIRVLVCREGKGIEAFNCLEEMKSDGVKPDVNCYCLVMKGLVEKREFKLVDKVFDELLVIGLVPDIECYNVYINGLCKQKKFDEGMKMVASIEGLGCKADTTTYNMLLESLCEGGELDKGREIVKEMRLKGVQINSQMYQFMIDDH